MSFETHNTADININGTSLKGYVTADYNVICRVFGEPTGKAG